MTDPKTAPFGLVVVIRGSQAHRRELFQTLEGLRQTVRREDSTCECEVLEDCFVPNRFSWEEWWSSEGDLLASLRSDRFVTLMAAIELLGTVETVRRLCALPTPMVVPDGNLTDRGESGIS